MSTDEHLDALLARYPDAMTPSEVAEVLRLKEPAVRKMLATGRLPGFRMDRHWITAKSELRAYLQQRHNTPTTTTEHEHD